MALTENALVTLEEVKQWLGIEPSDTSKDFVLEIFINGISDMILKKINRNILAADYTENIQGSNTEYILLKNYPVNRIDSILIDNFIELDNMDYEKDSNGILFKGTGWSAMGYSTLMSRRRTLTDRTIKVSYNAGYEEVPSDLKLLTLELIQGQYELKYSGSNGMKQYKIDQISITWADEIKMSETQLAIINSYKKVLI